MKDKIKQLLREALDKTITCRNCGWSWKESESDKEDLYVCHKCGFDNSAKESINETIVTKDKKDIKIIADFVNFAKKHLNIDDDIKVALAYERTPDIKTSAYYDLDGFVKVYVKDRAVMDVCRSIAHELVHHKQNLENRISDHINDGGDGSEIENEANAVAGVIIRKWGKLHPELYK
jgi:ribosomal protein L37E